MFEKKRDHCIIVKFGGTTLKTRVKPKSQYPQWNEKLMFPGFYPSFGQSFQFDVMFCILPASSAQITFDSMLLPTTITANRQVEQSPTFGPAYVELRNTLTDAYFGRILLSIRTEEGSSSEVIQYRPAVSMDIPSFVEVRYRRTVCHVIAHLTTAICICSTNSGACAQWPYAVRSTIRRSPPI